MSRWSRRLAGLRFDDYGARCRGLFAKRRWKIVRAGKLRHVVTLQQPTTAGDAYNSKSTGYSNVGEDRISFEPLNGRELHEAKQTGSELVARVRMRYRDDIKSSWRIVMDGVTYEVVDPPIDRKHHKTELEMLVKVVT